MTSCLGRSHNDIVAGTIQRHRGIRRISKPDDSELAGLVIVFAELDARIPGYPFVSAI